MHAKIIRYGLAVIFGLALVSLTAVGQNVATPVAAAPTVDASDILSNVWERIKEAASKTAAETVEGLTPIAEKAANKLTEKVTKAATAKGQELLNVTAKNIFEKLDDLLGTAAFEISKDMGKEATQSFKDIQTLIDSVPSTAIDQTLTNLSQMGTSAQAIAESPTRLTNAIIELNESLRSFEKIEQAKRALDSVAQFMRDAVEQGLNLFDKAYDTASNDGVFSQSKAAKQANEAIIDIREQMQERLSAILNQ